MTEPVSNNINMKPQAKSGSSWPREIAFAMIAIGTGIGAGVILRNKEVTDDPKSLGIAGGVTITTYGILKLLFRQHQNESAALTEPTLDVRNKTADLQLITETYKQEEVKNTLNGQEKTNPRTDQEQNILPNSNMSRIGTPSKQVIHEQEEVENASNEQEKTSPRADQEQNILPNLDPTNIKTPSEQVTQTEETDTLEEPINFASLVEEDDDKTNTNEKKKVTFTETPPEPVKSILKNPDLSLNDNEDSDTDTSFANTSFGSNASGYYTSDGEEPSDTGYEDSSNNSFVDDFGEVN